METDQLNNDVLVETEQGPIEVEEPVKESASEILQEDLPSNVDLETQTGLKRARENGEGDDEQAAKRPKTSSDSVLDPKDPIVIPTEPKEKVVPEPKDYTNIFNFDALEQHKDTYSKGTPYPHVIIPDFLSEDFIEELRENLNEEEWFQQRNDVLEQEHTTNLRTSQQTAIVQFQKQFYSPQIRDFVSSLVKFKIQANVDCVGEIYKEGSHYICHHSGMAQRRVAFFLFLAPETWEESEGGTLNLYNCGTRGEPTQVGKSIIPAPNTLVIFETTPNIFYEISEVLAKDKELVLISGFFRSASRTKPKSPREPKSIASAVDRTEIDLSDWIDPPYFNSENQKKLKYQFERHHFVVLESFLKKEKYDVIANCIKDEQLKWKQIGPPNRRHYQSLDRWNTDYKIPHELEQLRLFIQSKSFIEFLHLVTNQTPHTLYPSEYRKFKHGDYTTTADQKEIFPAYSTNESLDLHLGFRPEGVAWNDEHGGDMVYLDGEDEMLSVIPSTNTLSLVLRDHTAKRFVRYFEEGISGETYDLIKTYVVASKDQEDDGDYDSEELKQSDEDIEDDDIVEDGKGDDYY